VTEGRRTVTTPIIPGAAESENRSAAGRL